MIVETNNPVMGRNLLYLRRKKRLSRGKLAELVGIHQNTLFCIEHQTIRFLDNKNLQKVSQLFQVTVEELMEKQLDKV